MHIDRLKHILFEATRIKDSEPEPEDTTEQILRMFKPPRNDGLVYVDCEVFIIGVDPGKALEHRAELVGILKEFPSIKLLQSGPSYLQVGAALSDFGVKFEMKDTLALFALGQALGFWAVQTPKMVGAVGADARKMIENGHITITPGFDPRLIQPPQGDGS